MNDELRARLADVLANATAGFVPEGFERINRRHGDGPDGHSYDGACALCRGEIGTLLDALMPVIEAWHNKCHYCQAHDGDPHPMTCPRYVGAVEHGEPTVRVLDNGVTQHRCTCGWFWHDEEGETCPNSSEKWRRPAWPGRRSLR